MISEYSTNIENNSFILDLFIRQSFFSNVISYLNTDNNKNETKMNHPAQLYLIEAFVNFVTNYDKFEEQYQMKKQTFFIQLLNQYGVLIYYSLNQDIFLNLGDEEAEEETQKEQIKQVERLIESKLISIEVNSKILNNFINDNNYEDEDEELEEVNSDNDANDDQMDQQEDIKTNINENTSNENNELGNLIKMNKLIDLLIKQICSQFLDSTDESLQHIKNSCQFLKNESLELYLTIMNSYAILIQPDQVKEHFVSLLNMISTTKSFEEENNKDSIDFLTKLASLIYDLFTYLNDSNQINNSEDKLKLINSIKDILLKYKIKSHNLCIKLARIVGLISIQERDKNLINGKELIELSAIILIELTSASFQCQNDDHSVLKLNAELLDLIIDLFSEDCLKDLEIKMGFIQKMKQFSDLFYSSFKTLNSKKIKMKKDSNIIIKTVKDNLKNFVDYKIKNSK